MVTSIFFSCGVQTVFARNIVDRCNEIFFFPDVLVHLHCNFFFFNQASQQCLLNLFRTESLVGLKICSMPCLMHLCILKAAEDINLLQTGQVSAGCCNAIVDNSKYFCCSNRSLICAQILEEGRTLLSILFIIGLELYIFFSTKIGESTYLIISQWNKKTSLFEVVAKINMSYQFPHKARKLCASCVLSLHW